MWDKIKKTKERIDIYGPQNCFEMCFLASFIFFCIVYVVLLTACGVWAVWIPIEALVDSNILNLLWWIPCCLIGSILISIGVFVATKLDII